MEMKDNANCRVEEGLQEGESVGRETTEEVAEVSRQK